MGFIRLNDWTFFFVQARPNISSGAKKSVPLKPKSTSSVKRQSNDALPTSTGGLIQGEENVLGIKIPERTPDDIQKSSTIAESILNSRDEAGSNTPTGNEESAYFCIK